MRGSFYNVVYRCNVFLPFGISQIYEVSSPQWNWFEKWPFWFFMTNVALFLPPLGWSPHLKIVSGLPLTQVQLPFSLTKPMCHLCLLVSLMSLTIRSNSCSVSMETKSPPSALQKLLFSFHVFPKVQNLWWDFLKQAVGLSTDYSRKQKIAFENELLKTWN